METKQNLTNWQLFREIDKYNNKHDTKIKLSETPLGYKIIYIGQNSLNPMTLNETFFFVKGLNYPNYLIGNTL